MFRRHLLLAFAVLSLSQLPLRADPKIDDTPLADADKLAGYAISPHGVHTAVLLNKGSRYIVAVDGADGPKIDTLLAADGTPFPVGNNPTLTQPIPVLFSDDGSHYAYFARAGNDFFLFANGKEIYRAKYDQSLVFFSPLQVTSKHVFFGGLAPSGQFAIFVDGAPGPDSHLQPQLVVSPDGNHFAYVGTLPDGHDTKWAVVDGRQVKFFGDNLQFTPKGHLLALQHEPNAMTLNVDNKNVLRAGYIQQLWISPRGGQIAALIRPQVNSPSFLLTINGKPVPASQGATISNLYFSPDDKHFAALVSDSPQYVIIDGKKGDTYQSIPNSISTPLPGLNSRAWSLGIPAGTEMGNETQHSPFPGFTADGSKFLYVAQNGPKCVLVCNDDESDPSPYLISPELSPDGNHYAYVLNLPGKPPTAFIDGKALKFTKARPGAGADVLFSPDGNHSIAFDSTGGQLYIDGKEQPDILCTGLAAYSPDSRHWILLGHDPKNDTAVLYLDGKPLVSGADTSLFRPTFSADSKHLFWVGHRPPATSTDFDSGVLWVDGKATPLHFNQADIAFPISWQANPDGSLTFVARTTGDLHKYHITPDPNTPLTK